ncbi:MarR family winged helix-turn-helix transcriptional regulator [Bartonella tamiae]|uniref:HTH marR-type domain-containing protein n=1 Tax=Bartonella tamiae Th239 TaxID=1094558 RepID=J1JXL6_9HYPH|nr:MarR family transcriptional regulator [Bartonella tamiae]EJF89370.1 hypothetical protein ME5_01921 [Bartonella tamiae Th239]EJF92765.1 hypothetical protein MEG_01935 [Bartonella tamiae Th307]
MTKNERQDLTELIQSTAGIIRKSLAQRLYDYGLYAGQDRVILALAAQDGQSPSVLAKRLGIKPPTVTKTIARLQEQGFVIKRYCHKDQRLLYVFLTKNGRNVVKIIEKALYDTERDALSGIHDSEKKNIEHVLIRIRHNLSNDCISFDSPS